MKTIIVAIVFLVLYMAMPRSTASPIGKKEFFQQLENITNRGTESSKYEQKENRYDSPCGWYRCDSVTRRPTVFVRNTCPDHTYMCMRTGEDVDMSAYVYHCRQNKTIDDRDK